MLIWWTNNQDCLDIGGQLDEEFPEYLKRQYWFRQQFRRSQGSRLWPHPASGLLTGAHIDEKGLVITQRVKRRNSQLTNHDGIPIYKRDVPWVINLPGTITDADMNAI